mmetsp:Transcript_41606/g.120627  ORF Transcript_41606/g.120627 Transcript_41606/m.120627 type:complete len:503 (+) Transcript_41606:58-1566(+)
MRCSARAAGPPAVVVILSIVVTGLRHVPPRLHEVTGATAAPAKTTDSDSDFSLASRDEPHWRRWLRRFRSLTGGSPEGPVRMSMSAVAEATHERLAGRVGDDLARSVMAFAPSFMIAWADESGAVYTWEAWRKGPPRLLGKHHVRWHDARFLADQERLLTIDDHGLGIVWNTTSGKRLHTIRGHGAFLELFPDGIRVLLYGASDEVEVWNASSGERLYGFKHNDGYPHATQDAKVSPDGRQILVHSANMRDGRQYVSLWSAETGQRLYPEWPLPCSRCDVALVGEDDEVLVCEHSQGGFRLTEPPWATPWMGLRASTGEILGDTTYAAEVSMAAAGDGLGRTRQVECLAVSDDGRWVAQYDYQLQQLTVLGRASSRQSFEPVGAIALERAAAPARALFLPGGMQLVFSRFGAGDSALDGTRYLWDIHSSAPPQELGSVTLLFSESRLVTDGRLVVAKAGNSSVSVWNARTGGHVLDLKFPPSSAERRIACLALSSLRPSRYF